MVILVLQLFGGRIVYGQGERKNRRVVDAKYVVCILKIVFPCVGSPSSIETTETKNYRKIFAYLVRLVTEK